jgi:hypothetical protein
MSKQEIHPRDLESFKQHELTVMNAEIEPVDMKDEREADRQKLNEKEIS